jgi:acetaldehyde dehydrogenase/alcohol dehydrogenase
MHRTDPSWDHATLQEKLSPILAMYRAKDFEDGMNKAERLLNFAGAGHTAVHYTNTTDT